MLSPLRPRQSYTARYINFGTQGDQVFATTTCLDFVHAFARPEARDLMALSLLDDCRRYRIRLNAYVVMSHHIHMLLQVPETRTIGWVMNRIKSNSARRMLRILTEGERRQFSAKQGLNGRVFWMVRYRSTVITSEAQFSQKVRYTHENPVRAGLVTKMDAYRWSSARAWSEELWSPETGLDVARLTEPFEAMRPFMELNSLRG